MTSVPALNPVVCAAHFGDDAAFLKGHTEIIVLSDPAGRAKLAIAPAWQGRVMTSTAEGDSGLSFGWINRELIASGKILEHINPFGGEDRFWMGPEGGQFSIFFARGAKFELSDWHTPPVLDTVPWKTVHHAGQQARFVSEFTLTNYAGTRFVVAAAREVRLLNPDAVWQKFGVRAPNGLSVVAYESDNQVTNMGQTDWKKETGLLSIWILGMFNPSPSATIVVPIQPGAESQLGVKVTSDYFGQIPPERLKVKDSVIFFSADGKFRSKIGISPKRSRAILGSYDPDHRCLTLVQFTQPSNVTDYVNSLWKIQENPFQGDAANSYNDGPPAPGAKPLGPFYELESSSPALALTPGQSYSHIHRTVHLTGSISALDEVSRAVLGVSLEEIQTALGNP
ncbi:MAG TPA: hypothetical protein PK256_04280 [Verrucomicrobiota bacterium]|nr:hypothetical protein [Verrucomicrobiota bacterium]